DPTQLRSRAAAFHLPRRVADTEVRRPLSAGIGRRTRHDRNPRLGRNGFAEIDSTAAPDREHAVADTRRCLRDLIRRNLCPARTGSNTQPPVGPPLAGDQERFVDAEVAEHAWKLAESPADDHVGRCSCAYSRNARAACVSVRPLARARKISRTG